MPVCPNCGNVVDASFAFCPNCGTSMSSMYAYAQEEEETVFEEEEVVEENETTKKCEICGTLNPVNATHCSHCGFSFNRTNSYSQLDQQDVSDFDDDYQYKRNTRHNSSYNKRCNTRNTYDSYGGYQTDFSDPELKNKWISIALCLFLGAVGGHKFYEGKIGSGLLYMFTDGLFGIGILIDLIKLLSKPTYYKPD